MEFRHSCFSGIRKSDINVKAAFLHLNFRCIGIAGLVAGGVIIYYESLLDRPVAKHAHLRRDHRNHIGIIERQPAVITRWRAFWHWSEQNKKEVLKSSRCGRFSSPAYGPSAPRKMHSLAPWVSEQLSNAEVAKLKQHIKHELEHLNIQHATLETETGLCLEKNCEHENHVDE